MMRTLLRTLLLGRAVLVAAFRALRNPLPSPAPRPPLLVGWKKKALEYALLLGAIGILGFLGAASGVIPIKASSGHWGITRWFLQFSMRRSVATHSLGIETPRLDDPLLILKGAGAYETACRSCHGSPDVPHPRVAGAMLPRPEYLPPRIAEWSPRQLFTIVKHGVKFTGMPAWPSQSRDDEVWAVVAFLRVFPRLDAAAYRGLVHGTRQAAPAGVPPAVIANCARCHGVDGMGRGAGAFPKLAGQRPTYFFNALRAFHDGTRHSGMMEPIAAALSSRDMREIAIYYGSLQPSSVIARRVDDAAILRGRSIATRGIPAQEVPACADCHGPASSRKNDAYPVLAGQYADYLVLQLELFRQQHRGGSRYAHLMRPVATGLTPQQMRDVALYYESLGNR